MFLRIRNFMINMDHVLYVRANGPRLVELRLQGSFSAEIEIRGERKGEEDSPAKYAIDCIMRALYDGLECYDLSEAMKRDGYQVSV